MLTALLAAQDIADEILKPTKSIAIEMVHLNKKMQLSEIDVAISISITAAIENEAVAIKNHYQLIKEDDDDKEAPQPTLSDPDSGNGLFFPEFGHDYLLMAILRSPPWVNNAQIQTLVDKLPIANLTKKCRGWFLQLLGNLTFNQQKELISIVNAVIQKGTRLDAWTYIELLSLAKYFADPKEAAIAFAKTTEKTTALPYDIAKANHLNFQEIFRQFKWY